MMAVGERIQQLRKQRGMTLSELSRRSGVSRGFLHLVETGDSNPTMGNIAKIADALAVEISQLTDHPPADASDEALLYYWHHRQWAKLLALIAEEMAACADDEMG